MVEAIKMVAGKLEVPANPTIPYISGDGIGPEIFAAAQTVFDAAVLKAYGGQRKVSWHKLLAGKSAYQQTGSWLPAETLTALKKHLVAIKGPLETPVGEGHRSLNVTLRQELDLYTCLRPVTYYQGTPSPVVAPEQVNMVVFRENTEDIYAGIEFASHTKGTEKLLAFLKEQGQLAKVRFPESSSFAIKPVSSQGTKRLVKAAINYALAHDLKTVTLVHKGNIMKRTEGSFRNWGYQAASEFGDKIFSQMEYNKIKEAKGLAQAKQALNQAQAAGRVIVNDLICDNFFQQALLRPSDFDVIATLNLNGDYISDALAAQVGGIGIAPGANINYQTGQAIFEATHGTAPQFAGQNKLNPTSLILSGKLMFDYLGWSQAADLIESALAEAIASHHVTVDFAAKLKEATTLSTSEFGQYLAELILQKNS